MKHAGNSLRRIMCALLIAIFMVGSSMPALAASKGDVLTVKLDYARLRAKPESGSEVLTKLRKGSKVVYMGQKNGWYKLRLANGKLGFMYKDMLQSYSKPKVGKVYRSNLRSGKLAVYAKASKNSKKLGALKSTTNVVLLKRDGLWGLVRIVKNGRVGYVNLKYLKASR